MTENTEKVVLEGDADAAKLVTVTGWVSRLGQFYGDDERLARFAGATHRRCERHGTVHEIRDWCRACHKDSSDKKFAAMPREEWDGTAMLYCQAHDKFFQDADDLVSFIEEVEAPPQEVLDGMQLVICEPEFPAPIDPSEHYCDSLPEDGEPPAAVIEAFDALNEALRACKEPLCWWPGKKAAIVTLEQLGIEVQQEQSATATLWCIRIPGPDDVHAMASKEAAEKAKVEHDAAISKWYENPTVDKKFLPLLENMLAVVERWPHDAASHAEDLAQQEHPAS